MTRTTPGHALRLAVIGWGLGELAMGHRLAGMAWLAGEVALLAAVALTTILFADTSWYLVPYLLGMLFLVAWLGQAVLTYHRAQRQQDAVPPTAPRSPALAVAWLTIPLLAWATGFWVFAAGAATPSAVTDRFVTGWSAATAANGTDPYAAISQDPGALRAAAVAALDRLEALCAAGELADDCATATENLLRNVRVSMSSQDQRSATAVAELVSYERRPSTFLGIFAGSELVPVPVERIITVELRADDAALGAVRWTIVNAEAG